MRSFVISVGTCYYIENGKMMQIYGRSNECGLECFDVADAEEVEPDLLPYPEMVEDLTNALTK